MTFRYSPLKKLSKKIFRSFFPVPKSPWTAGPVDDICAVNLVPPEKLISFFSRCMASLKEIKGDDIGDYLEFGVFNGNSIASAYAARTKTGPHKMRLFGFDAFEGLPQDAENEDGGVWKKGFYACSLEQTRACISRRNIPPEEIQWVEGWYDKTLNQQTSARLGIKNIGIAFIDCDTYSSSKAVRDFLSPLIEGSLIICLDDWKLNDLDLQGMGEYRSFNEFLETNPHLQAKEIKSYNRKSKSFLISPRKI